MASGDEGTGEPDHTAHTPIEAICVLSFFREGATHKQSINPAYLLDFGVESASGRHKRFFRSMGAPDMGRISSRKHNVRAGALINQAKTHSASRVLPARPKSSNGRDHGSNLRSRRGTKGISSLRPLSYSRVSETFPGKTLPDQFQHPSRSDGGSSNSDLSEIEYDRGLIWTPNTEDENVVNMTTPASNDYHYSRNFDETIAPESFDSDMFESVQLRAAPIYHEDIAQCPGSPVPLQSAVHCFIRVSEVDVDSTHWQCPMTNCHFYKVATNVDHDRKAILDHLFDHTDSMNEQFQLIKEATNIGVLTSALTRRLQAEAKLCDVTMKAESLRQRNLQNEY